jgi:hypothetical protein
VRVRVDLQVFGGAETTKPPSPRNNLEPPEYAKATAAVLPAGEFNVSLRSV